MSLEETALEITIMKRSWSAYHVVLARLLEKRKKTHMFQCLILLMANGLFCQSQESVRQTVLLHEKNSP